MKALVFAIAALAGVTAHAALYHLLLHFRRGDHAKRDGLFAATAFGLVLYDACCIGLYTSETVAEGREWQRLQLATISLSGLGFIYFVGEFAVGPVLRAAKRLAFLIPIPGLIGLFERSGLLLTDAPKVVRLELPVLGEIVYNEAAAGPLQVAHAASAFYVFGYVFAVGVQLFGAGQRRRARMLTFGAGLMAIAVVNDILVSLGVIASLYLMEFAWTAVVVLMGYSFSEEVVAGARAKQELADARMRLAHADRLESVGRLAGGIAHDLNNMLTPVVGYAALVRRSLAEDSPARAQLDHLLAAAQRAAALARKLLALGRKQVLEVKPTDVGENVRELVPLLRHLLPSSIRLHLRVDDHLPPVEADGAQLEQVWMNLVANARDAMPNGGDIRIEVRRSRDRSRAGVEVEVTDAGVGIDAETIAHVFEPFYTTKQTGEGTGLGLAIVRGIVEQHGGRIDVSSQPGEGTTFHIFLPATARAATQAPSPRAVAEIGSGRARVLVVDDDAAVLAFVAEALASHGYDVATAQSAHELGDVLARADAPFDLLVTDVVIPETDGTRVFARVAARFPAVRCVYMTAHADDVLAPRGVLRESVDLLRKPFTADELLRNAREALAPRAPASASEPAG